MASPTPRPAAAPASRDRPAGWWWMALLPLCLAACWPALGGTFLWDDSGHVTRPDLQSWAGLFRIWFEIGATQQYYPVLHSAFWLEHHLWGEAPLGYHLLNVGLHATAATQLAVLLRRLQIPGAWLAGALFALHPVGVESVAWISEQKNTLSAVLYLAAALAWLRFDTERRPRTYALASALFGLALLTKTVTATLPAALLVLCWWRDGRLDWRRQVAPLLPWFAAGAAAGLFTAHFERTLIGASGGDFALGFLDRVVLAGRIFWFYLGSLAWPFNLTFIYPRWTVDASAPAQWLPLLAGLALLGGLVWWSRRSRAPLAAGLLFAGTLFPVLGFFNVYPFVYSYVADHFQYHAGFALFALAGAALATIPLPGPAAVRHGLHALLLLGLGTLTWFQSGMYRDPVTLYETTLRRNPAAWMAHHNLAIILSDSGRIAEAVAHLETAVRLRPGYAPAANNLGYNLLRLDRATEAVTALERAIALKPDYSVAHRNLGLALATQGKTAEALAHFQTANRLNPADDEAELNQGIALMLLDRFPEAISHFERAVALAPESAGHRFTYGRALAGRNRPREAIGQFDTALALHPGYAEAHYELAKIYRRLGRRTDAARHYRTAIELDPTLAAAP